MIVLNEFVRRQTKDSRFSHYGGDMEDVVTLTARAVYDGHTVPGFRDGVLKVSVDPTNFFSGVVQLKEGDELTGSYTARRQGETPRKVTSATGRNKIPAKNVDIIIFSSKVLAENGDNSLPPDEGNWEVISINADPTEEPLPINPWVLLHNHFESDGGTDTRLSDTEFVETLRESFTAWKDKAMCG